MFCLSIPSPRLQVKNEMSLISILLQNFEIHYQMCPMCVQYSMLSGKLRVESLQGPGRVARNGLKKRVRLSHHHSLLMKIPQKVGLKQDLF
jgi:hypothetical protein